MVGNCNQAMMLEEPFLKTRSQAVQSCLELNVILLSVEEVVTRNRNFHNAINSHLKMIF